MSSPVVTGAVIMCTSGLSPGQLIGSSPVSFGGAPALTIKDVAPITNICPCGMCTSMANPAVASATAAALGVLTPQPCVPAPAGIWMSTTPITVGGVPGLASDSTLMCAYAGTISIRDPGQKIVRY